MKAVLTAKDSKQLTEVDKETLLYFHKDMLKMQSIDCSQLGSTIADNFATVFRDPQERLFAVRILLIPRSVSKKLILYSL